ncbi:MAG: rRNA maturation RNase YbeY [Clostridia bacterium]|nr:rRNA maturation RNase YbeY [Clostridia bacterium]
MKTTIYISDKQNKVKIGFIDKSTIRKAVRNTLRYEDFQKNCEVSVTLTDNEEIRKINAEYRKIDRPTDVLSFPIEDEDFDDGEKCILGDIIFSAEKAFEQAKEYGHSFKRELAFLTVHSTLHLLGYDHETSEEDEKEMFAKQEEILNIMKIKR